MKWRIAPKKTEDIIEQLLINRGILKNEEREIFFNPKISDYEKDLNIAGIEKSLKRINMAIKDGELIIIYGDYDVDGICASAILYKALTSIGAKVLPYIPHREKEGYGLSNQGLDFAKQKGASVVITVDNGIVAINQAEYAKELGLDLIITDHHQPMELKPEAFSIVHSTKMCGAAVAWCLVRGIIKKELSLELLQFVAIATICDVLPLVGLGRAFVYEGIKVLNNSENPGLLALINESGLTKGTIGSYEIGHIIGPRLNAIGRLEHAIDALRLLCTKDLRKARDLAKLLCETNILRQKMTQDAFEEAQNLVNKKNYIHVLYSESWSSGIIGLIAGKIAESYSRPAIAISVGQTIAKGSARSVNGVNIVEIIRKHSDILISVGGHPGAAGFSLQSSKIKIFKKRIEEHVLEITEDERVLEIDTELDPDKLTKEFVRELEKFEPFGFGNPRPIFASFGVKAEDIRTVGQGKHLKFKADKLDAIAFGMGGLENDLKSRTIADLAYTPEFDTYNGLEKLQLKVKDIKFA